MGGRNTEGYADPTASEAVGRVFKEEKRLKEMCNSCKQRLYCPGAYKKDTWCGNFTGNGGR